MADKSIATQTPSKRTFGDLIIIFITALLSFTLASILDAFEILTTWAGKEVWEIDQLFVLLVALVFAFGLFALLGIFSVRRWMQLQRELDRRRRAEEALQKAHDELEIRVEERTAELSQANAKLKQEVTERIQAEEALRASEVLFRNVITSISDHIYVTEMSHDGSHKNRYLSNHAAGLTGYPLETLMGDWSFWPTTVIHPDDRESAASQASQLAKGLNSEVEYRLIRSDGEVIWVRDSARVERESDSSYAVFGVVSDITERKRAEAEIRELNEELENRVLDRTRKLAALYEVTAVANRSLDLKLTLKLSLERLLAAMRCIAGAIHLLDEAEELLELATEHGVQPEVVPHLGQGRPDGGLAASVIEQNRPVLFADLQDESDLSPDIHDSRYRSYVGVPIRARGNALGVLSVLGTRDQQFNEGDVALLTSIADQVGVAVENAHLQQQAEQGAVMRERARLARELHDAITQSLYSLTLFAEAGIELAESNEPESIKHNFVRIGETALQALKEMRLLVYELRPTALKQGGLIGALHERLNAVEGRVNVKSRLVADDQVELSTRVEEGLYRIAQEALNNILKHAAATSVTIFLRARDDRVELEIVDDGTGFNPDSAKELGGMGLDNMRVRAEKLGGSLQIMSEPDGGTRVLATASADRNGSFGHN
jgi:PAS domain S-box-containing protein